MLRTRSQVNTTCKGTRQHRTIHGRFLVSLFSWSWEEELGGLG